MEQIEIVGSSPIRPAHETEWVSGYDIGGELLLTGPFWGEDIADEQADLLVWVNEDELYCDCKNPQIEKLLQFPLYFLISENARPSVICADGAEDDLENLLGFTRKGGRVYYWRGSSAKRCEIVVRDCAREHVVCGWWKNGPRAAVWMTVDGTASEPILDAARHHFRLAPLSAVRRYDVALSDPLGAMRVYIAYCQFLNSWRLGNA